ncbi:unnamed protein product [Larinioides sclopetarius]|uniref:Uncharacterized protein n=1 Tax=Larinioides sclopetarius TaxID=280406 RepID=A0AAV1Z5C3_9ARAC
MQSRRGELVLRRQ